MAFTSQEIEFYHDRGLMPDWAYYQQNGKSALENYREQKNKYVKKELKRQKIAQLKKDLEKQLYDALFVTLNQSREMLAAATADDIINSVNAAVGNGSSSFKGGQHSFSTDLAVMLGKALGDAPFKLLDEILDED